VNLPLAAVSPVAATNSTVALDAGAPDMANYHQLISGLRVLVVDDEPDTRALLALILREFGAVAETVSSADEALKLLETTSFNVLVCDIQMPRKNGYSLMQELRRRPPDRGGNIPAAAVTAHVRAEDRIRALAVGYQVHLPKPVEPTELIAVVASLAGRVAV
jgi:CheY-like chemotaxis protein